MKQIAKLSIILMLFSATAGGFLAGVYKLTKPHIDFQRKKEEKEALAFVFPLAEKFEKKENNYYCYNKKNKLMGYVIKATAKGYGGKIIILAGVTTKKEITGIKILEHQETPGLGANITLPFFYEQFTDKRLSDLIVVKQKNAKNILSITGATISSRAVTDSVKKTIEDFFQTQI
jgi:Na+-translocating ferredoxin:NAD+ oxidoreductase subunit G